MRSRFATVHVSAGEVDFLRDRYDEEDVSDRVARLHVVLRRLLKAGLTVQPVHAALGQSITQERRGDRQRVEWRNRQRLRTRRAFDDLLACVDRQLPTQGGWIDLSHHRRALFRVRRSRGFTILCIWDGLLQPQPEPKRPAGRPVSGRQVADMALRAAGVRESDRAELLSALGLDDEENRRPTRRGGRTAKRR